MVFSQKSRASFICCFFCFLHQSQADNLIQRISTVRSLPRALLVDYRPKAGRRRRVGKTNEATLLSSVKTRLRSTGYFYGLGEEMLPSQGARKNKTQKESLNSLMNQALSELKGMRQEMESLRNELKYMKKQYGVEDVEESDNAVDGPSLMLAQKKKQREWDKIGMDIEKWAEQILFKEDHEEAGWKEVSCSKLCAKYNKEGNIKCYIKWMRDSRGIHATDGDEEEYPCIKIYTTIDAPMEQVCSYLADESSLPDYNDLVVKYNDLEEISPHSKVCWGQSPKILFIKPRNFVTFCHHRWLRDGTQVVVNQACNHEEYAGALSEAAGSGKALRAYALRGANFISPVPDDPNKTRFSIVAHANPGPDISPWMCRLAVNNLAPIEPFKLFYKIGKFAQAHRCDLNRTRMVNSQPGRSNRPGGLSQMGYACFWPNGGGLKEGLIHSQHPEHVEPETSPENDEEIAKESNVKILEPAN